jgi:membrane complex biogenesis BtpA family protein
MIDLKKSGKTIIAMIHIGALPGTPKHHLSIQQIIDQATNEAEIYIAANIDALMIENTHDIPYLKCKAGAEIVAAMTAVSVEIRKLTDKPLGIQILAGANKEALAVAKAASLDFIRAEGFVFGHLADEGYIDSCAGELLRYRKMIGAETVAIFTDIKKKHSSHAITSDVTLEETISAAEFFLSDGIIITGSATGKEASLNDVKTASRSTKLPVIIGSGITDINIETYWPYADAFIVGSSLKLEGNWRNNVDKLRVNKLINKVQFIRQNS